MTESGAAWAAEPKFKNVRTFLIHTLGCKLNSLESEAYYQVIGSRYQAAGKDDKPSIIIVNTCTVTSKADQKARRVIRKALRDYPEATVIVTGCYAGLEPEAIKNISRRDAETQRLLVFNRAEALNYIQTINKPPAAGPRSLVPANASFQFFPQKFNAHTRSFLKIQDGCDNHCTYCRIRLARGKSASLPAQHVLERLRILEQTHAEAVLTGVNISQYQDNNFNSEPHEHTRTSKNNLFDLLEFLLSNTNKIALRLSSLDPQFIVENLLPAACCLLPNKRIRPHFHLSIQSGSEKILQRMGRSYNAQTIEKAASLLRGVKDDPFLACDIITGFPGETEREFNETFELCKKLDFAWIHVFPYSKRPGTEAARFKDSAREGEVTQRVKLLTCLAWQGRRDYVKRWLGKEAEAIIQGAGNREAAGGYCHGLSENYLKVKIRCESEPPSGTVLRCRFIKQLMKKNEDLDVTAEIIS